MPLGIAALQTDPPFCKNERLCQKDQDLGHDCILAASPALVSGQPVVWGKTMTRWTLGGSRRGLSHRMLRVIKWAWITYSSCIPYVLLWLQVHIWDCVARASFFFSIWTLTPRCGSNQMTVSTHQPLCNSTTRWPGSPALGTYLPNERARRVSVQHLISRDRPQHEHRHPRILVCNSAFSLPAQSNTRSETCMNRLTLAGNSPFQGCGRLPTDSERI